MTSIHMAERTEIDSYIWAMAPISLDSLTSSAGLLTRVDRKYVLTRDELAALLLSVLGSVSVLEIDGKRSFGYESVYFDTPGLASYNGAVRGRPDRFKVRTRTYLDAGTSMLEVKTKGRRGETIKQRCEHVAQGPSRIGVEGMRFINAVLPSAVGESADISELSPTITTSYDRVTLVGPDDVSRITIDANLSCIDARGARVHLDGKYVVETKSAAAPCAADRALWSLGRRPEKISKYGIGVAALNPELSANKWHRTLQRHVHVDTTEVIS